MLPQIVRLSLEICPGAQEVQEEAPSSSEIEFCGHLSQLVLMTTRYVPAEHLTEEGLRICLLQPAWLVALLSAIGR